MTVSRRPLVLAALFLLACAFTFNPATLIQRKWKQTPESVKNQIDAILAIAPPEQAEMIKAQRATLEAMQLAATLEFKEGKVIVVHNGQTIEGTYTLSADNKTLVISVMGQQQTLAVKSISETQMVVTDARVGVDGIYVPAQ